MEQIPQAQKVKFITRAKVQAFLGRRQSEGLECISDKAHLIHTYVYTRIVANDGILLRGT